MTKAVEQVFHLPSSYAYLQAKDRSILDVSDA